MIMNTGKGKVTKRSADHIMNTSSKREHFWSERDSRNDHPGQWAKGLFGSSLGSMATQPNKYSKINQQAI